MTCEVSHSDPRQTLHATIEYCRLLGLSDRREVEFLSMMVKQIGLRQWRYSLHRTNRLKHISLMNLADGTSYQLYERG